MRILLGVQGSKIQFSEGMNLISSIISSLDYPNGKLLNEWNSIFDPLLHTNNSHAEEDGDREESNENNNEQNDDEDDSESESSDSDNESPGSSNNVISFVLFYVLISLSNNFLRKMETL